MQVHRGLIVFFIINRCWTKKILKLQFANYDPFKMLIYFNNSNILRFYFAFIYTLKVMYLLEIKI